MFKKQYLDVPTLQLEKFFFILRYSMDEVLLNKEKGNICGAVFLDLLEAFDAVDYGILMSKLSSVGVSPGLWSGFLRI